MRTIIISKNHKQQFIKESLKSILNWKYYGKFNQFVEDYPDHTFEFCPFNKQETGLGCNILLDETGNHFHDEHPLWMYVKDKANNLIPITIHRFSPIPLTKINYKLIIYQV